ncbi:MAG: thioredoxin domain-containing protein [Terriglobales bacterium]
MKRTMILIFAGLLGLGAAVSAQQRKADPNGSSGAALKARVHAFLSRSLGWQNLDKLEVQSISVPDASGMRTATVYLAKGGQHQTATYLITPDGREIIEGQGLQTSVLSSDPWAENRARLRTEGAPAVGSPKAPVTIVEFSDLECPYCKQLSSSLESLQDMDPGKARVIFKVFPLTEIHPWSMTAAEAAVCVTEQGSSKFWNFEKGVFAAQDNISTSNAGLRLSALASEAGANLAAYNACLTRPSTHAAVVASLANGKEVGVKSTPTMFIDGRPVSGAIPEQQLQMLVDYEAGFHADRRAGGKLGGAPGGEQCGKCTRLPPLPPKTKKPGGGGGDGGR